MIKKLIKKINKKVMIIASIALVIVVIFGVVFIKKITNNNKTGNQSAHYDTIISDNTTKDETDSDVAKKEVETTEEETTTNVETTEEQTEAPVEVVENEPEPQVTPETDPPVVIENNDSSGNENNGGDNSNNNNNNDYVPQAPEIPEEDHIVYNADGTVNLKESYWYFRRPDEYKFDEHKILAENDKIIEFIESLGFYGFPGYQFVGGAYGAKITAMSFTYYVIVDGERINFYFDGDNYYLE